VDGDGPDRVIDRQPPLDEEDGLNDQHAGDQADHGRRRRRAGPGGGAADLADKHGKPIIITEYGDTVAGLHSVTAMPWTEEYQVDLLDMSHRVFGRVEAVVGEQVWNFADFMTGPGVFRVDGNKKGIFTAIAGPRPAPTSSAGAGGASADSSGYRCVVEVVVGTRVVRVVDVEAVVDDVVKATEVVGTVSSLVDVVLRGRVVVVVGRGAAVLTGTRTAGTSSVGGGGWGRTQR
jgi:hypothetical protein